MDLIKAAGLLKTVTKLGDCYECLVREFIVNIPSDITNRKSDVYGFGVVLVEILTGLRALDSNRPSGQHKLTEWVKPYLHDRRKLKGIMDSRLEGKFPSKAAFRIAQLSMKCLASEPKHRPSMKDVLENLERIQAANEKPVEPKFRSTHAASRQGHQAVHHRSPRQDGSN